MLKKNDRKILGLGVLAISLLFLGFYRDQWHLVPLEHFSTFQTDSESLVIGRMVHARQDGLLADGGLLGWGDAATPDLNDSDYAHQYDVYLAGDDFHSYMVYESQSGLQATLFSVLDSVLPFSNSIHLRAFRALTSSLTALVLSALVVWFYVEFGWVTSLTVLLTMLASQWITLYGRNLFYSIWSYFLPMVYTLYWLHSESSGKRVREYALYWAIFGLVLFKCLLSGYDFLLPPLGMIATAVIYYGLRDRWVSSRFARRLSMVSLFATLGVLLSFLVVAAQVGSVTGKFSDGLLHIFTTIGRRTIGSTLDPALDPVYQLARDASLKSVLDPLIHKVAFLGGVQYIHLLFFFALVSLVVIFMIRKARLGVMETTKGSALLIATWISLLSPLSWVVFFKAHAYFHLHTTSIIWHMPFVIFGFALFGWALSNFAPRKETPRT